MATTTVTVKGGTHLRATAARFTFTSTAARVAFNAARTMGQPVEVAFERAAQAEARVARRGVGAR